MELLDSGATPQVTTLLMSLIWMGTILRLCTSIEGSMRKPVGHGNKLESIVGFLKTDCTTRVFIFRRVVDNVCKNYYDQAVGDK